MGLVLRIDLPSLRSIAFGDYAFNDAKTIKMAVMPSLQSIDFGSGCFNKATSFSLVCMVHRMR